MPRDGSGIYTLPPGTKGVPDTTIESSKYNAFADDVASDANAVRPIIAGGTGASSAAAARAALGVTSGATQVTNYDSHVFETGSFYSLSTATAAPLATNMSGTAVVLNADPNYVTLDAVDNATGLLWTRHKTGGVWSAWALHNANDKLPLAGGTLTGPLTVGGDVTAVRSGGTTGAYFFGNFGKYLYFDGTTFQLAGGGLTAPAFNGPLNGNATTATNASNAYACSGNAASANVSASCSGNAASSSSCSGNAASANFATTSGSCSGNAASASSLAAGTSINCADFHTTGNVNADGWINANLGFRSHSGGDPGFYTWSFTWGPPLTLYVSGVFVGGVSITSDYRAKKDMHPLSPMWDKGKALNPIRYKHKEYTPDKLKKAARNEGRPFIADDGIERWGFTAHELQDTLIESAATGRKDEENVLQSPNPMTVIAALTKALQEAMGRIEALEGTMLVQKAAR